MFKQLLLLSTILFFGNVQLTAISNPLKSEPARAVFQISGGMCTAIGASMLILGKKTAFWKLLKGVNTSKSNGAGLIATGLICLAASNPTSPSTVLEIAGSSVSNIANCQTSILMPYASAAIGQGDKTKYPFKQGIAQVKKLFLLYSAGWTISWIGGQISLIGELFESIKNLRPLI